MSNEELLVKIKTEIDKKYAEYREKMKSDDFTYYEGMADALDLFEQFIDALEEPVPADLEEAAKDYSCSYKPLFPPSEKRGRLLGFIARAKWAMNQGVKATGTISPRGIIYDNNVGYHLFLERYHNGDKVEVQIRKIEENGK